MALKYDKLYKKIARDRWESTKYTSESGTEAINKRWGAEADAGRTQQQQEWTRSSQELGDEFGVSHATIERVRTILEQIQSLRDRSETAEGPGVRVEDVSKKFTQQRREATHFTRHASNAICSPDTLKSKRRAV